MLIIVDKKMNPGAKKKLAYYGELLELETDGITYPAISGHPDIFFCRSQEHLILAPNLPHLYFEQLKGHHIDFITGEMPVGPKYPASARYNAVATDQLLIHNFRHIDFMITRALEDLNPVHVDQGYCRCNLLPLKDGHFISSDAGIYKVLSGLRPEILFIHPEQIKMEGFPHGFFGGCCGIWKDTVFINGSLKYFLEGEKVRNYLHSTLTWDRMEKYAERIHPALQRPE